MTDASAPSAAPGPHRVQRNAWPAWVSFASGLEVFNIAVVYGIFVPYFVNEVFVDSVVGQERWGYAAALGGLIAALLAPAVGFLAENVRTRRLFLLAGVALNALPALVFVLAEPGIVGVVYLLVMAALVVAMMANDLNYVLLGATLTDVAEPRHLGITSAAAVFVGWVVGLSVTAFMIFAVVRNDLFGLNLDAPSGEPERLSAAVAGLVLLVMCAPLALLKFPQRAAQHAASNWTEQVRATVSSLMEERTIAIAILARFFYWSGLVLVQIFGASLARSVFGWDTETTFYFSLAVLFAGALGALIGGFLDDLIGSRNALLITVLGLAATMGGILTLEPDRILFVIEVVPRAEDAAMLSSTAERFAIALGAMAGLFIGPMGPVTRTLVSRLAPPGKAARYFGLSTLAGNSTNAVGPFLVAVATGLSGDQRLGLIVAPLLLIIGAVILLRLPPARELRSAQS